MRGAREYYDIISGAAYRNLGRLDRIGRGDYRWNNVEFRLSTHARGKCFYIVLVDGDTRLEVYGVTGGNPGWTETYGWKKRGTWVIPILRYIRQLEREIVAYDEAEAAEKRERERQQNAVIAEKVGKFNAMFQEVTQE